MNPFVFIVGCARSGTTLLQRIVDAHPNMAITPEMHWITDYFRQRKWLDPDGRVTPEQVNSMMDHKRFRQFDFTRAQFQGLHCPGDSLPYADFLNRLFEIYGLVKGKKLVGNKTPAYVRRIPELHAIWPEAKFVHLVRDGRDVCLSVLNWNHAYRTAGRYTPWTEDPIATTALWWKRKVLLGRQGGEPLRPHLYYEIHYEDLVTRPEDQCAQLCSFLGVPYDDAMLRFHEGRMKNDPGLDAKKAWRPVTPGLRDWRTQMLPDDVARFEAIAGDLLDELGYRRSVAQPSADVMRQASRIRKIFIRDLNARGEVVPECW